MSKYGEDNLQIACVNWFRLQYPKRVIYAVPNGGKRSKAEAGRFKAMGVLAGVSDLCIPEPMNEFHGLYIELKDGLDKYATPSQREFIEKMNQRNYCAKVAKTFKEFVAVVKNYFEPVAIPLPENFRQG